MIDAAVLAPEKLRPLRRTEYDRLVKEGAFDDQRIELLDGMLVQMSPQDADRAEVIEALTHFWCGRSRARRPSGCSCRSR